MHHPGLSQVLQVAGGCYEPIIGVGKYQEAPVSFGNDRDAKSRAVRDPEPPSVDAPKGLQDEIAVVIITYHSQDSRVKTHSRQCVYRVGRRTAAKDFTRRTSSAKPVASKART